MSADKWGPARGRHEVQLVGDGLTCLTQTPLRHWIAIGIDIVSVIKVCMTRQLLHPAHCTPSFANY
jgi:hypothetical protein